MADLRVHYTELTTTNFCQCEVTKGQRWRAAANVNAARAATEAFAASVTLWKAFCWFVVLELVNAPMRASVIPGAEIVTGRGPTTIELAVVLPPTSRAAPLATVIGCVLVANVKSTGLPPAVAFAEIVIVFEGVSMAVIIAPAGLPCPTRQCLAIDPSCSAGRWYCAGWGVALMTRAPHHSHDGAIS